MGLFCLSALSIDLSYNTELYQILDFLTAKKIAILTLIWENVHSKIYIDKSYNTLIKLGPALNLTGQPRWLVVSPFEFCSLTVKMKVNKQMKIGIFELY